jgi:hypothetical protein
MASEWLNHFKSSSPQGRPEGEGWLTRNEMAEQAGVSREVIRGYLEKNEINYEKQQGSIKTETGGTKATFYRLIPSLRGSASKRRSKGKR